MRMRGDEESCERKRLQDGQRSLKKKQTLETLRNGGSRIRKIAPSLRGISLAPIFRGDLHRTIYSRPSSNYSVPMRFKGFASRIIKPYLWLTDISTEPSSRDHSRCRESTTSLQSDQGRAAWERPRLPSIWLLH